MITDHTSPFTWKGPGRQPAALLVGIDHCLHILTMHFSLDQCIQWKLGPESIPETGVGKHVAGMHFTIVRAEIIRLAVFIQLIKFPGEKTCSEHTGIECSFVFLGASLYLYFSKCFIPDCRCFRF